MRGERPKRREGKRGAGRAFLPLSKIVTARVGRRPPQPLRDASPRTYVAVCRTILVRLALPGQALRLMWAGNRFGQNEPASRFEPIACALRVRWTASRRSSTYLSHFQKPCHSWGPCKEQCRPVPLFSVPRGSKPAASVRVPLYSEVQHC